MKIESLKVYRASAGTGKTFRLVQRILQLILIGENPEQIFATTFTRKAAAEIRERLIRWIANGVLAEKGRIHLELTSGTDIKAEDLHALLVKLCRQGKMPKIGTIDAFISEMARAFSFEIGFPEGWRMADEGEITRVIDRAMISLVSHGEESKLSTLSRIIKDDRSVRSIYLSLKYELIESLSLWREGAEGDRVKSWAWFPKYKRPSVLEWEEAKAIFDKAELPLTKSGTPNAYFVKGRSALSLLIDEKRFREITKSALFSSALEERYTYYNVEATESLKKALGTIVELARREIGADIGYKALAFYELLTWFDSEYLNSLINEGIFSFDELRELLASKLLSNWKELLAFRLDSRVNHILFDEFQDTSLLQWRFFAPFVEELIPESGKTLLVVGDAKQSIYGWRGGVKALFDHVTQSVTNSGGSVESMTTSFRSSEAVLNSVNAVFQNLRNVDTKFGSEIEQWLESFEEHRSAADLSGQVAVKRLAEEEPETVEQCVALVKELHTKHPAASIGVLVRRNERLKEIAREFARKCPELEVSQEGGGSLSDEPIVIAVLALLKVLDHPGDTIARYVLANSTLGELLGYSDYSLDTQTIRLQARAELEFNGLFAFIEKVTKPLRDNLSNDQIAALDQLLEVALEQGDRIYPRVSELFYLAKRTKFKRTSEAKIRILTAHGAKGLEFDLVVLADSDAKLIAKSPRYFIEREDPNRPPTKIIRSESENISALFREMAELHSSTRGKLFEESLSVLYVMMTRAKSGLFIFIDSREKLPTNKFQNLLQSTLNIEDKSGWQTLFGVSGLYV